MNESSKACPTMTPVHEETEDEVMTEVTSMTTSTNPMRTSAHLAEKLNKYKTTESNNGTMSPEAMDIDMEEKK